MVLVRCVMWLCGKGHLRSRESRVAPSIKYLCLRRAFCCTAENDNFIGYAPFKLHSCHLVFLWNVYKKIKLHITMHSAYTIIKSAHFLTKFLFISWTFLLWSNNIFEHSQNSTNDTFFLLCSIYTFFMWECFLLNGILTNFSRISQNRWYKYVADV